MDELYPGWHNGSFSIDGFAKTFPRSSAWPTPEGRGQVHAGFGLGRLLVHQTTHDGDPSFDFRPLTTGFLANAISDDAEAQFSLAQRRLGEVTYVSGAAAREDGPVSQGIISLEAVGKWKPEGLNLSMKGNLGDCSALLGRPTPDRYKQASYWVEVEIPWKTLRFMFFDHIGFVVPAYRRFAQPRT